MQRTREDWDKTDGVQAHHVIQSFDPNDNITAKEANEMGRKLAEQIAPGHEAAVYTHTDREHIHNHIVINSVSFENGKKYHSDREQLYNIREASDKLCREHGLSVVQEPSQKERLTMAERQISERGGSLWKDELRTAIDDAKKYCKSLDEMKQYLGKEYGIDMKIQNKNVSFLHPEKQKYCRGKTLGEAYSKDTLAKELRKERNQEQTKTKQPGILSRDLPGKQPEKHQKSAQQQTLSKPQKGLNALRELAKPEQQHGHGIEQKQQKQGKSKQQQNKRGKSRMQQKQEVNRSMGGR